ncbi:acetylgalactosaminyl-O-glycosyl-glycoprotein beta-1,3-N-acetylglucosaminyltransferase [Meriones unguiculatus]|uniref:acetylgalactosaminyl-O-glycosyl-glycoprotein beta-1,3-N-acetylglucosaminyltransferase n=1 Tax=Meriones unguiculatus TaxID=10047 RepID=UPI000B4F9F27|nr:acetylgalactosaminyl-O-glycosyl-glycoprotein beta-1,3-N-acetylglucosaminyltransferase [Meriones unguiculatus]XP_060223594.1 acetylgalactosaminyl-O-glycosyl-glycoprotein beta-1,3-N-acetylglucosaminyltransferase [Meriones unguiculatus]
MALPSRRSKNPNTLAFLLAGVTFVVLHQWLLQQPTQEQPQESTAAPRSSAAAVQPSPLLPVPACVANASANLTEGFQLLPARIQDFLRYRHCRRFPQLWDAPHKCAGPRGVFLLLAIKSSPANFERRELIRRTWGQERSYGGRQVRRLFLLGTSPPEEAAREPQLADLLRLEARESGDVLQWGFWDTFLNLTLKHLHLLDWTAARCPGASFLLSCDDDVFVHTANVLQFLEVQPPERHLFVGQLMDGSVPIRHSGSKYFVPPQLFPGEAYPVYCSGGGFLLSSLTARHLRRAARRVPLFPIDDAYMGMCLQQAGLAPSGHEGIRPFGVQLPGVKRSSFDPCVYRELLLVHRFAPYEMLLMWKALHNPELHCSHRRDAGSPEGRGEPNPDAH